MVLATIKIFSSLAMLESMIQNSEGSVDISAMQASFEVLLDIWDVAKISVLILLRIGPNNMFIHSLVRRRSIKNCILVDVVTVFVNHMICTFDIHKSR
jgi:hypothetical protein